MAMKFKSMEYYVGFFIIICITLGVATLIYVGFKKELFADKVYYYAVSTSGENIERGIPVRLSGFNIGQVSDVELEEEGNIKVEMKILKKHMHWFRQDSRIVFDREGLIGNAFLQLYPGKSSSPVMEPGTVMKLEKSTRSVGDLVAEAQPAIEDLKEIVSNIRTITEQLIDEEGPVQSMLNNLETLSNNLSSQDGMVHYLTADKRPVERVERILLQLENSVTDFDRLVQNASGIEDDVAVIVTEIKEEVTPILGNVRQVSEELKGATKDLDRLRRQGEYTLDLSNELLLRLKNTWPFARDEDLSPPEPLPSP